MGQTDVYIVVWEYLDKSGFGVVAAFDDMSSAERTHDALCKHGDHGKRYTLLAPPDYEATP